MAGRTHLLAVLGKYRIIVPRATVHRGEIKENIHNFQPQMKQCFHIQLVFSFFERDKENSLGSYQHKLWLAGLIDTWDIEKHSNINVKSFKII